MWSSAATNAQTPPAQFLLRTCLANRIDNRARDASFQNFRLRRVLARVLSHHFSDNFHAHRRSYRNDSSRKRLSDIFCASQFAIGDQIYFTSEQVETTVVAVGKKWLVLRVNWMADFVV
jgi:hypothetical protein